MCVYGSQGRNKIFIGSMDFFHYISHISPWKFQQNKGRIIIHNFIKEEVYIQDGHLASENLGLKIHLSSLLIPFQGLLVIYHDLI